MLENYSEQRKQRQEQKLVETALNEAQGDYGKAAQSLGRQGMWELAKPLEEKAVAVRQQARERRDQEFGQMLQRADALPSMYGKAETLLNEVTPDTYARAVPVLRELATSIHPDLAAHIPEQYEPGQVEQMRQSVGVLKQKATRMADGLKQFLPEGDPIKGLTTLFEVADTDEERAQIAERAAYFEVPKEQIALAQRLAKRAGELTPAQRATDARARVDDARADAAAGETKRHNAAMETIGRQREARLSRDEREGTTPTGRATAERWKSSQLDALEGEFSDPQRGLTVENLRRRQLQIENSYRAQIGLKPLAALPAAWMGGAAAPPPAATPAAPSAAPAAATASQFRISAPQNGRVTVTAPDGSTAQFGSREEADAAIAEFLAQPR